MVIRLQENDGIYRKAESAWTIWRDGRKFHENAADQRQGTTLCEDAFKGYSGSASSQLALWYGVTNFLGHVEKVWNLRNDLGGSKKDRNFRRLQCEMLKAAERGKINKLPEIEAAIWKELLDEI